MSIVSAKELPGRGGVIGQDSNRHFVFYVDSNDTTEHDIYRHRLCPKYGSRHPNQRFNLYYLKPGDLSIQQGTGNEKWKWTVEAKYTRLEPNEPKPDEQPDPANSDVEEPDWQPHVSVDFEEYAWPITLSLKTDNSAFDADSAGGFGGYPPVNSALEPYDPPIEIFRQNAVIRVTRNLGLRSRLWKDANTLKNTVNVDKFEFRRGTFVLPVEKNQCRIKIRIGEQETYITKTGKEKGYANLEVQFVINEQTWNIDVLDAGSKYLSTAGKTIAQRITDDDWGLAVGTDQKPILDDENNNTYGLLAGDGTRLPAGAAAVFNRYPGYFKANHSSFFKRLIRRV